MNDKLAMFENEFNNRLESKGYVTFGEAVNLFIEVFGYDYAYLTEQNVYGDTANAFGWISSNATDHCIIFDNACNKI